MEKFVSKQVIIEAMQLDLVSVHKLPEILGDVLKSVQVNPKKGTFTVQIKTLEGVMRGGQGDWLIRGTIGEFYFCKAEVFTKKYEAIPYD